MGWLDGITNLMDVSLSKLWEIMVDRAIVHWVAKSRTELRTEQQQLKCGSPGLV